MATKKLKEDQYPKMLYRSGWGDPEDCCICNDSVEEDAARKDGFKDLGPFKEPEPDTGDDLV